MPTPNTNVARLAVDTKTSSSFIVEEWVDLPEYIQRRDPMLREWNTLMKEKFERMQLKMVDFIRAVQETS